MTTAATVIAAVSFSYIKKRCRLRWPKWLQSTSQVLWEKSHRRVCSRNRQTVFVPNSPRCSNVLYISIRYFSQSLPTCSGGNVGLSLKAVMITSRYTLPWPPLSNRNFLAETCLQTEFISPGDPQALPEWWCMFQSKFQHLSRSIIFPPSGFSSTASTSCIRYIQNMQQCKTRSVIYDRWSHRALEY